MIFTQVDAERRAYRDVDHRWDHQTLSRKHQKDMTNAAGTFDHRTRVIGVTDVAVATCVEINQCVGCSAMTRPRWLRRAVRNRHRHAIEQASRRWHGGRRDDSARTRRKLLISTQAKTYTYDATLSLVENAQAMAEKMMLAMGSRKEAPETVAAEAEVMEA